MSNVGHLNDQNCLIFAEQDLYSFKVLPNFRAVKHRLAGQNFPWPVSGQAYQLVVLYVNKIIKNVSVAI